MTALQNRYNQPPAVITAYTYDIYSSTNRGRGMLSSISLTTRHLNYIYAGNQIASIHIQTDGETEENTYYVHTDHLGSYNVITDHDKEIVQRFQFSAWGNRMNPLMWTLSDNYSAMPITTRGFTGHEHLPEFNIINMKGRLYDPAIARFFSPDPHIQVPDFTQNLNRYSYCLNNPLMYTDPEVHISEQAQPIIIYSNWGYLRVKMYTDFAFSLQNEAKILNFSLKIGI